MFKKLLLTPSKTLLSTRPVARVSNLKEYICLYESLNSSAVEQASNNYNSIAKKYNINKEDLMSLFKIINSEPELLKEFVNRESWLRYNEEIQFTWRNSAFYIPGVSFQDAVEQLKQKYPEVANFDVNLPERARAYQVLENIFLRDGPKIRNVLDNNAIQRFQPEFSKRIQGHVNELRTSKGDTQSDVYADIARALGRTVESISQDPSNTYGGLRHLLAVHKLRKGELKLSDERLPKVGASRVEQEILSEEIAEEVNEIELLTAEKNTELRKELNYNFLPWINDRKIIFEAQVQKESTFIWGALAGTFGAYLLYKLYEGDATDTTLLGTIVALGLSVRKHRINSLRNRFGYLVQMNLHRNGQQLDLFIQKAKGVEKIEGVPISDFQLHRGDYSFKVPATAKRQRLIQQKLIRPEFRLSDARALGVGLGNWVATYGQSRVFVPMDHTGNRQVLDNIFKGKSLELTA